MCRVIKIACVSLVVLSICLPQAAPAAEPKVYPLYTTFLLGGWHDGAWQSADDIASAASSVSSWWLYGFTGQTGRLNGRHLKYHQELGGYYDLEFYEADNVDELREGEIAVGNLDKAMPRKPKRQTGGLQVYESEVRKMLDSKGLKNSKVVLSDVVRCDLDGDGSEEVIIVAQTADATVPVFRKGTYTIVLFRHVVKGKVETVVLREFYYLKNRSGEADSPENFSVPFCLDANADGIMEIILEGRYYEGSWYEIHEYKNQTLKKVLSAGVGA